MFRFRNGCWIGDGSNVMDVFVPNGTAVFVPNGTVPVLENTQVVNASWMDVDFTSFTEVGPDASQGDSSQSYMQLDTSEWDRILTVQGIDLKRMAISCGSILFSGNNCTLQLIGAEDSGSRQVARYLMEALGGKAVSVQYRGDISAEQLHYSSKLGRDLKCPVIIETASNSHHDTEPESGCVMIAFPNKVFVNSKALDLERGAWLRKMWWAWKQSLLLLPRVTNDQSLQLHESEDVIATVKRPLDIADAEATSNEQILKKVKADDDSASSSSVTAVDKTASYEFVLDSSLKPSPRSTCQHPYEQHRGSRVPSELKVEAGEWEDKYKLHGFVQAVHESFNHHYKLVLKPTDVWQLIIDGVAKTVADHAEELRSKFVEHEGKQKIIVDRDEFVMGNGNSNDWPGVFDEFSSEIEKRVTKSDLPRVFTRDYSTSTPLTRLVSHITLMGSMKGFFKYILRTRCGIPSVRLEGTVDDWSELLCRVDALKLHEIKLEHWVEPLRFVLRNFESSRQGRPDLKFWRNFYKYDQQSGSDEVSGFMLLLFPDLISACTQFKRYSDEQCEVIDMTKLSSSTKLFGVRGSSFSLGVVSTPFTWLYYGKTFPMTLFAGFGDCAVQNDEVSVTMGWKAVHMTDA